MTFLIADDSPPWRRFIRSIFRADDKITECCNGVEAVAAYEREQPDWVVMDIIMDKLDGLGAASEIKARHPGARIVLVTQFSDPLFQEAAERLGAEGYVLKDDLTRLEQILWPQGREALAVQK